MDKIKEFKEAFLSICATVDTPEHGTENIPLATTTFKNQM